MLLPSPVKIFEAPSTLPLSFVVALKKNPGTGGNTGLIKSRATLKLGCFTLTGRSCYRRSDESQKNYHFNCLIIIFSFFVYSRSTFLLVSLVNVLVPPWYLGPVCLVDPLLCFPPCTSMWGASPPVPVLTATRAYRRCRHYFPLYSQSMASWVWMLRLHLIGLRVVSHQNGGKPTIGYKNTSRVGFQSNWCKWLTSESIYFCYP